jgi:menaquinone-specific isochorismate synthase
VLTAPSRSLLTVSTVRLDEPLALLEQLPETGGLAWVRDGEGLVGWGESARLELAGGDRFAAAQEWWSRLVEQAVVSDDVLLPGSGLVAFGSFAFDADAATSVLVVPEVVVGRREGVWWLTTIASSDGVPAQLPSRTAPRPAGAVAFADGSRTATEWMAVVDDAVARIRSGDLEKVVLARDVEARTERPLDVRWALQRLAADYPDCWAFLVDGLLGATPETLVQLREGVATSRVLAGTLRRSGDPAQDRRRGEALARSVKDVEEHGYGVRSVVDGLAPHCSSVEVPALPFVLELRNVMHLATDVLGVVDDGATSLELVAALHPSAAVCGSPTEVALQVIREVEGLQRGRYAGPVGWLGATGDGEWGIALRCAELDPDDPCRLRLFAGCGIVAGSRSVDELAESAAKLVPVRDALQA